MRQIVFDLETTGFKFSEGHRIVEIGAVELINGAISGQTYHTYVDPQRDVPEGAYRVHGLSTEFLRGKPVFTAPEVAAAFLDFVGDSELIAHNGVGFDLPFLNAELAAAGLKTLQNTLTDTLLLARRKFPGAPASLDALCSRFGIDTKQRERVGHGALLDSRLLAEVYIELTGGAQAGLAFLASGDGETDVGPQTEQVVRRLAARSRPQQLAPRITQGERDAHAAFVAELGDQNLWAKAGGN